MSKKYGLSLFIFRRDLRLTDNTTLIHALSISKSVIPVFIFTPEQITTNPYKSNNAIQFMVESLNDLDEQLHKKHAKLIYFYGKPHTVVENILRTHEIDAVFVNKDYTAYSTARDTKIQNICTKHNTAFIALDDCLMHDPNAIKTTTGKTYTKFTPYFNKAKHVRVNAPKPNNYTNYAKINGNHKLISVQKNDKIAVNGGRRLALNILANMHKFKDYNKNHNILSVPTTRLSPYIKFGCVSIRETYYAMKQHLGPSNDLFKQLHWREFYYNICIAYPRLVEADTKKRNYNMSYNKIHWITHATATKKQKEQWNDLLEANTGIPIIDACIMELTTTGFLHNRGRLILGSFIVKNMYWHWLEGEKLFSNYLVDIDLINNSSNWCWIAGSGSDVQPFFRVFNAWTQQEKYDPDCKYIKTWLPVLKNVETKHIHKWYKYWEDHDIDYPEPMLDVQETARTTIQKYKHALFS